MRVLGSFPGPEAREALERLRDGKNKIIRENAVKQLIRPRELWPRSRGRSSGTPDCLS
jgi:hypothetical protein